MTTPRRRVDVWLYASCPLSQVFGITGTQYASLVVHNNITGNSAFPKSYIFLKFVFQFHYFTLSLSYSNSQCRYQVSLLQQYWIYTLFQETTVAVSQGTWFIINYPLNTSNVENTFLFFISCVWLWSKHRFSVFPKESKYQGTVCVRQVINNDG